MVGTAILFHCYYSFEFCVGKSSTALKVLVKFTIQISTWTRCGLTAGDGFPAILLTLNMHTMHKQRQ